MKKITEEEFKEYMEYKKFMSDENMSMEELDDVVAAKRNDVFEAFMQKIREMEKQKEEK